MYVYIYIYVCIYTNLPVNVIVRLPHSSIEIARARKGF